MKNKVAIIYTTFLRDELMKKTLESIVYNWRDNYVLLIGDQNKENRRFNVSPRFGLSNRNIKFWNLPYDCGLSVARNYLVNKAYEMGIKYVLISADSIQFTDKYNFTPIIDFLKSNPKYAKVGFNLENRQNFTYDLEIHPKYNKFVVIKPRREPISHNNIEYTPCDLCCNFCLVKTAILKEIAPYDPELKLAEHEDQSYRLKQAGYKTFWTDSISAEYINDKPPEYDIMRKRLYGEFKDKLKKKYNLDPFGSWLIYAHKIKGEE